ncbi:MAG: ester cyclase [Steroidobacteraceae bacterium]
MRIYRPALLGCILLAAAGCATTARQAAAPAAKSQAEANKAVVLAFTDTVFNKHDVAGAFKQYVGPAYIQHNPKVPDGVEGAIKGLTYVTHTLYPDLRQEVKRVVAEGNLVAIHTRQIRNAEDAASGRGNAIMDIFRLENGKIVEHWDVVEEVPATAANNNTMF